MLEKHMREEETQVFPRLKTRLSEEKNRRLTKLVIREGFMAA